MSQICKKEQVCILVRFSRDVPAGRAPKFAMLAAWAPAATAEEVVDMRGVGGGVGLTQTYFYSIVW